MYLKRPAAGLSFCLFYLASYFTNKYVLSVLKFTYPTLFQGWQTLVGGFLLHVSWKLGWVEISCSSRSEVLTWLPASALFVGIIYAGSRALSRLPIPVFLTVHNAAEVITCGFQKFVQKETSLLKICSVLFLLIAAGCLPLFDMQFDPDGYFWALIHLICVGVYKVIHKLWKTSSLSDLDQQYINYVFSVVLLASASHPAGDLFSALDFPFLYFYRFHSSCCASGLLGFFLMLHTVKLKSITSSWQYAAWSFLAKVTTAGLSPFVFGMTVNVPTVCCSITRRGGNHSSLLGSLVLAIQQGSPGCCFLHITELLQGSCEIQTKRGAAPQYMRVGETTCYTPEGILHQNI
ncbi:transmembrane protein 241 isoform X3 [Malaclemys terrapin pileata]|uniref:transmembrane protein 241 isoform X3 n=1 Tax=Malaclemys terrapin pileata TaxID=2991368 RepID=UPI0023A7C2E4|nr:transmembrane protein 241 isoform X3 [Malaclemys terrapin pileata]